MGYAFIVAPCVFCGIPFPSNPNKVPSIRRTPDGPKEPMCLSCHGRANETRKAHGLEPWPDPLPGAYEACPEEELP